MAKHLPLNQTTWSQPEDHDPPAPSPDARAQTIRCNPSNTATLADEVIGAVARLLGRQLAREWSRTEG